MKITDTTPEAGALQRQAQRRLSGGERLMMALEMSLFARELAKARILKMHPQWSESQIVRDLIRMAFLPGEPPMAGDETR